MADLQSDSIPEESNLDMVSDSSEIVSPEEKGLKVSRVLHQETSADGIITHLFTPCSAVIHILIPDDSSDSSDLIDGHSVEKEEEKLGVTERGTTHADGLSEFTTDEGYSTVPDACGHGETVAEYQKDLIHVEVMGNDEDEGETTHRDQEEATLVNPDSISIDFAEMDEDEVITAHVTCVMNCSN